MTLWPPRFADILSKLLMTLGVVTSEALRDVFDPVGAEGHLHSIPSLVHVEHSGRTSSHCEQD